LLKEHKFLSQSLRNTSHYMPGICILAAEKQCDGVKFKNAGIRRNYFSV